MGERQPLMELNMDPTVGENSNDALVTPIRYEQETTLKSHSSNKGNFFRYSILKTNHISPGL